MTDLVVGKNLRETVNVACTRSYGIFDIVMSMEAVVGLGHFRYNRPRERLCDRH